MPLQFAWSITRQSGRAGMLAGILCYFGAGCLVALKSRRVLMTVVYGGWVVAASQAVPFLQMISGIFGVTAAGAVGQSSKPGIEGDLNGEAGGFIATVVTGGILLVAALVLGLVIRVILVLGKRKSAVGAKSLQCAEKGKSDG